MNKESLELYTDYLLSTLGYATATGLAAERKQGLRSYAEAQRNFGFSPFLFEDGMGLELKFQS